VPMLVFAALRTWALATARRGRRASSFDSSVLVFSTGWVGIATVIILMYIYETHFGSLYLHVGVISSLFMVGLTAGALFIGHLVPPVEESAAHGPHRVHRVLLNVLLAHGLFLAALAWWFAGTWGSAARDSEPLWRLGHSAFAIAFIFSGLCCGGYWPLAAARLAGGGLHAGEAGSRLETADHLGACLGGLATSLLAVPVLGTRLSLLLLIGLVLANVPAAAAALGKPQGVTSADERPGFRQLGYVLFGFGACLVIASDLLTGAAAHMQPTLPEFAVRALAAEKQVRPASAVLRDTGKRADYLVLSDDQGALAGYLFSSADFAPEVRGFGGRLNLAFHVDASGRLVSFLFVRSNETPSYLDSLRDWLDSLKGRALFDHEPFAGVTAVTGATVSSQAVLAALQKSGQRFAIEALALTAGGVGTPGPSRSAYRPDPAGWYLLGAFLVAFVVVCHGGFRGRLTVLVSTLLLGGILLNAQYSTEQIVTLLSLNTPGAAPTGVFLLAVGVPVLVLLFGNLYCGYLCPFGAAQELLGYVLPRRFRPTAAHDEMRPARFVKYVILAVLLFAFFLSRDRRTLAGDPLVAVFNLRSALSAWPTWMPPVVTAALVGSLFYARFWCRYLCPAGAFLSLLNHVRLLRRWVPGKRFGRCEFGLTTSDHLDCLYCDRCRHGVPSRVAEDLESGLADRSPNLGSPVPLLGWTWLARPLILGVMILGLFVAGVSLSRFRQVMPVLLEEPVATAGTAGQPRDVDVPQVRTLIDQDRLSDHKAEYYRPVE
jgi:NosR/NirI family nitrous oxide reductase transcriptional regulator